MTAPSVLAGAALEWCRQCREKPAEMIVWGKLNPPEALGPRCYDCAAAQIGHRAAGDTTGQHAIYRLDALARHVEVLTEALRDLHAEVEMAESVGICLPDRVPSLRAGAALAAVEATPAGEQT